MIDMDKCRKGGCCKACWADNCLRSVPNISKKAMELGLIPPLATPETPQEPFSNPPKPINLELFDVED